MRQSVSTRWLLAGVSLLAALALGYLTWSGGSFVALWATPDQLGRLAYDRRDFAQAAALFQDPDWLGTARFRQGQYVEAAAAYALRADATGFYNRGVALVRGREYAQAIGAFELAVEAAPEWPEARANLELARHILDYIQSTREQSGTDGKLEADEYRYDPSAQRGQEAVIRNDTAISQLSTEKWMRSVDTQTSEFLSQRFALEASRRSGQ